MLTPQELQDIRFDKAMFGGYDMAAVDETVAQLVSDYTALTKENAVLKGKLKLLASTVEEYRSVDEAMRKALITAQNMANAMVKEAHEKSDELIRNASEIANTRVAELAEQIREEEAKLSEAKANTAHFIDTMIGEYKKQVENIMGIRPEAPQASEEPSIEDTLSLATDEINKCVASAMENVKAYEERAAIEDIPAGPENSEPEQKSATPRILKQKEPEQSAEKKENPRDVSVFEVNIAKDDAEETLSDEAFDPMADSAKTRKFNLDDLKFGKNYDFDDE